MSKLHVAVLMGGWSAEREVSLMSGNGIADALEELGHKVSRVDMDRDVAVKLAESKPDIVFNALHGTPGEDGTVQGMLDLMGLKYTHSGLVTSVIAIDKQLTKQALVPHGIPMPGGRMVRSEELYERDPLPRPYVLKPVNEGSSVGVAIVTDEGNYGNPIARDAQGAVAGVRRTARRTLHPRTRADHRGARRSGARRDRIEAQERLLRLRREIHRRADRARLSRRHPRRRRRCLQADRARGASAARLQGRSRSDFRWDDSQGADGLFLLEVNTQPGMTPLSLVPEQARHLGISYAELVQSIVDEAL